jgi:hypothetical protein
MPVESGISRVGLYQNIDPQRVRLLCWLGIRTRTVKFWSSEDRKRWRWGGSSSSSSTVTKAMKFANVSWSQRLEICRVVTAGYFIKLLSIVKRIEKENTLVLSVVGNWILNLIISNIILVLKFQLLFMMAALLGRKWICSASDRFQYNNLNGHNKESWYRNWWRCLKTLLFFFNFFLGCYELESVKSWTLTIETSTE